jgi:predicted P-loop ATPase
VLESSDVQSKHPIRDYLKSVQTLTVKEDYVAKLFGLITLKDHSHSGLMLKLFRKWLAQCVIQIMEGDFASELCLVLIGPQGCGKTRFIRSLLPKSVPGRYLRTMSITGRNRSELQDEFEALARSWILFDDEWKGVTRTDDQEHLKALLSEKSPQWRAPYDRKARARRRNAVLCGASNRIEVVNDRTGNRRVIPMEVEKIDHVAASQFDLDLLFAQLMQEYAIKGISCALLTDYEITSLRTLTSQGGYNSTDIIMELLEQYTEAGTSVYSTSDIIKGLNALSKQYIRLNHRNVGSALKQLYDYQDSSKSENGKKLSYKGYGLRWKNHPNRNLGDMDKIYPVFGQDPDTYENSYYDDLIDLEEE